MLMEEEMTQDTQRGRVGRNAFPSLGLTTFCLQRGQKEPADARMWTSIFHYWKYIFLCGEATQFLVFYRNSPKFTHNGKILMNHRPSPKAYLEKTDTEMFIGKDVVTVQVSGIIIDDDIESWK